MSWVAAAVTVGSAAVGGLASRSSARKAASSNSSLLSSAQKAGAFRPLSIPKPQELHVPSAPSILSSWRGEVTGKFPEYDAIAGRLNVSEQAAARYANQAQNPQYYQALDQITSNALQASRGQIPQDVRENILRQANEDSYLRGFSYGTPEGQSRTYAGGNEAAANLALRNLGLTSMDMMRYGDQLAGQALDQSRAGRGAVLSAKDVVPTPDLFQQQMNAAAIAQYNYASDKAGYDAATRNAPIQSAYNKLALQMGIQTQNNALGVQSATNSAALAMSAMQALGGLYNGGPLLGLGGRSAAPSATASTAAQPGWNSTFWGDLAGTAAGTPLFASPRSTNQPVSSASSIRAAI